MAFVTLFALTSTSAILGKVTTLKAPEAQSFFPDKLLFFLIRFIAEGSAFIYNMPIPPASYTILVCFLLFIIFARLCRKCSCSGAAVAASAMFLFLWNDS